jgi:hypothetical protein
MVWDLCWIISGLDLREPLHVAGMDFGYAVFERGALSLIFDLAYVRGDASLGFRRHSSRLSRLSSIIRVSRVRARGDFEWNCGHCQIRKKGSR